MFVAGVVLIVVSVIVAMLAHETIVATVLAVAGAAPVLTAFLGEGRLEFDHLAGRSMTAPPMTTRPAQSMFPMTNGVLACARRAPGRSQRDPG